MVIETPKSNNENEEPKKPNTNPAVRVRDIDQRIIVLSQGPQTPKAVEELRELHKERAELEETFPKN